jgi:transposase InsO family protein
MADQTRREEAALSRYEAITPLLCAISENAELAKLSRLKRGICEKHGISERTCRRWAEAYQKTGFEGLKPMERANRGRGQIPESILEEAILLRREVPGRSVSRIIEILELEGRVKPGTLKRTTLQQKLMDKGYSTRQVKLYQQGGIAARRYARKERGDLWISDIKYGPHLKIGGEGKQIYLVCFMDDATRYILHAEYYDSMEQSVVEDCFRKAVLKEGVPKRVLFDNGKQYRTKWMHRACAILGIKLIYAMPYSPESKGKQERWNRNVDSFHDEAALMDIATLEEYNRYFQVWLSESYQNREHSALKKTPAVAYKSSKTPLRMLPPETVAEAFLHYERRRVDKSGCISFEGQKYEVGVSYVGLSVGVLYDPTNTEVITIRHEPSGHEHAATKLVIGEHTGPRPKFPEHMAPAKPATSRLLAAQEAKSMERAENARRAIKYSGFIGGGGDG